MELTTIAFYLFAFITLVSASIVVFSKNIVHSAFSLLFTFFGVAGLYVLLMADFLAITQLMIYVGGILILILFGVMLTTNMVNLEMKTNSLKTLPAVIITSALAGTLIGIFWSTEWRMLPPLPPLETTAREIGMMFLSSYILPFEIASVVLLVALFGSAMIARRERKSS
ncbi:MAG: NADH-quinone oxidoreductase subunit J [bacterium]